MTHSAPNIKVRPLGDQDSLEELTGLLHRAYAPLADAGFKFLATHQDVATTRERAQSGWCLVAERARALVGTPTLYRPLADTPCDYYRREGILVFGQFGVEPALQGHGIGRALLKAAEALALQLGALELTLDTAEGALSLIAMYERWGFEKVATADWRPTTNYLSVVMASRLGASNAGRFSDQ